MEEEKKMMMIQVLFSHIFIWFCVVFVVSINLDEDFDNGQMIK